MTSRNTSEVKGSGLYVCERSNGRRVNMIFGGLYQGRKSRLSVSASARKLHESGDESGSNEVFFLKCLLQRSIGLYAWKPFKGLLKEFIQSAKIVHQVT